MSAISSSWLLSLLVVATCSLSEAADRCVRYQFAQRSIEMTFPSVTGWKPTTATATFINIRPIAFLTPHSRNQHCSLGYQMRVVSCEGNVTFSCPIVFDASNGDVGINRDALLLLQMPQGPEDEPFEIGISIELRSEDGLKALDSLRIRCHFHPSVDICKVHPSHHLFSKMMMQAQYEYLVPENSRFALGPFLNQISSDLLQRCPSQVQLKCFIPSSGSLGITDNILRVTHVLDREDRAELSVQVECQVGSSDASRLTKVIVIHIEDDNDNSPFLLEDQLSFSLERDTKGDFSYVGNGIFYDQDLPDSNEYQLQFTDNNSSRQAMLEKEAFICNSSLLSWCPCVRYTSSSPCIFNGTALYIQGSKLQVNNPWTLTARSDELITAQIFDLNEPQLSTNISVRIKRHLEHNTSLQWMNQSLERVQLVLPMFVTSNTKVFAMHQFATHRNGVAKITIEKISLAKSANPKINDQFLHEKQPFALARSAGASEHFLDGSDILFMKSSDNLHLFSPGDVIVFHMSALTANESLVKNLQLEIRLGESESPCSPDHQDHSCAEFTLESECLETCGTSATGGLCHWVSENRKNNRSYSTCSSDPSSCPDGTCDAFEQKDIERICPQDCIPQDRIDGNPIILPSGNGRGLGLVKMPGLICSCHGYSCSCVDAKHTHHFYMNESHGTESTPIDNAGSKGGNKTERAEYNETCGLICASTLTIFVVLVMSAIFALTIIFLRNEKAKADKDSENPMLSMTYASNINGPPNCRLSQDLARATSNTTSSTALTSSFMSISQILASNQANLTCQSLGSVALPPTLDSVYPENIPVDSKWEIPRANLIMEVLIGEGEFGKVMSAKAVDRSFQSGYRRVAVKMLKPNHTQLELDDLLSEFQLLKEVDHTNVIKLLGACTTSDGPLCIIMEFAKYGSLKDNLRRCRGLSNSHDFAQTFQQPPLRFDARDILSFAWQISRGMNYLSSIKLVHRDLAARNVLLAEGNVCKISDFGMTRDVYTDDAYRKMSSGRIPVKWLAPESLKDHLYTSKSDVWSFGVLLWELVSFGAAPYPGILPERLLNLLTDGYRMDKPANCSQEIHEIMLKCWNLIPENRPSFAQIIDWLEVLMERSSDYLDVHHFTVMVNATYLKSSTVKGSGETSEDEPLLPPHRKTVEQLRLEIEESERFFDDLQNNPEYLSKISVEKPTSRGRRKKMRSSNLGESICCPLSSQPPAADTVQYAQIRT